MHVHLCAFAVLEQVLLDDVLTLKLMFILKVPLCIRFIHYPGTRTVSFSNLCCRHICVEL